MTTFLGLFTKYPLHSQIKLVFLSLASAVMSHICKLSYITSKYRRCGLQSKSQILKKQTQQKVGVTETWCNMEMGGVYWKVYKSQSFSGDGWARRLGDGVRVCLGGGH